MGAGGPVDGNKAAGWPSARRWAQPLPPGVECPRRYGNPWAINQIFPGPEGAPFATCGTRRPHRARIPTEVVAEPPGRAAVQVLRGAAQAAAGDMGWFLPDAH